MTRQSIDDRLQSLFVCQKHWKLGLDYWFSRIVNVSSLGVFSKSLFGFWGKSEDWSFGTLCQLRHIVTRRAVLLIFILVAPTWENSTTYCHKNKKESKDHVMSYYFLVLEPNLLRCDIVMTNLILCNSLVKYSISWDGRWKILPYLDWTSRSFRLSLAIKWNKTLNTGTY